jgi:hypothetical protein
LDPGIKTGIPSLAACCNLAVVFSAGVSGSVIFREYSLLSPDAVQNGTSAALRQRSEMQDTTARVDERKCTNAFLHSCIPAFVHFQA